MKNSPERPDPYVTANAQTQSNIATARATQGLNMVNQVNPYASLTYTRNTPAGGRIAPAAGGDKSMGSMFGGTGDNPNPGDYTATTAFTPMGQKLFDAGNELKLGQQTTAGQLLHGGQGAFSGKPLDLGWSATEENLNALDRKRLDPLWKQNQEHQESTLFNRGVRPGSEAYDNAMRVFNQGRNDAYDSSHSRNHQQAVSDLTAQYNSPLQTYSTLVNGTAPAAPNFSNTPNANVAGTNIAGLINDDYRTQMSQNNAAMGGMYGLGGAVLGGIAGGPLGARLGSQLGGMFGGSN